MDSQAVLYNKVGNDESYTPAYGVEPILKYIEKYLDDSFYEYDRNLIVWCPFDTVESEFVKQIKEMPFVDVIYSHIEDGKDFFEYEPEVWDIIISNPPFKNKRQFFERTLSFNKPFALLMTNTWLNDSAPKVLFKERDLQLLMFTNRMLFIQNEAINTKVTFSSSYYCWNFLPKQLIMEDIMTPSEFKKVYNKPKTKE